VFNDFGFSLKDGEPEFCKANKINLLNIRTLLCLGYRPKSMKELSLEMGRGASRMTMASDYLVRKGYAKRGFVNADRRIVTLSVTEKGSELTSIYYYTIALAGSMRGMEGHPEAFVVFSKLHLEKDEFLSVPECNILSGNLFHSNSGIEGLIDSIAKAFPGKKDDAFDVMPLRRFTDKLNEGGFDVIAYNFSHIHAIIKTK